MKEMLKELLQVWAVVIGVMVAIVLYGLPLWIVLGAGFWLIWQ